MYHNNNVNAIKVNDAAAEIESDRTIIGSQIATSGSYKKSLNMKSI